MDFLLNEKLEITPDNFYNISEMIIDSRTTEINWMMREEISLIRINSNRTYIMNYSDRIGCIFIQPFNAIFSMVTIGREPFINPNPNAKGLTDDQIEKARNEIWKNEKNSRIVGWFVSSIRYSVMRDQKTIVNQPFPILEETNKEEEKEIYVPYKQVEKRRTDVKKLFIDGMYDYEIAQILSVSIETVRNDRRYMKLRRRPLKK